MAKPRRLPANLRVTGLTTRLVNDRNRLALGTGALGTTSF
jgi:hypothetical protein